MNPAYLVWAIAVAAVICGWLVIWEEVSAPASWRYRVTLVTLWMAVTWIVGDWVVK